MRTMSWSRYHSLSWSFMRLRAGLRHDRLVRANRKAAARAISAAVAPEVAPGLRRHHPTATETAGAGRAARSESDPQSGVFEPKQDRAIPMSDVIALDQIPPRTFP
jgi:hypothetical protein